jgi:hypothetical protein
MITTREIAEQLARDIFDRIDEDRTLIQSNIAEVILNGLLLSQAKSDGTQPTKMIDVIHRLAKVIQDNPACFFATAAPLYELLHEFRQVYDAEFKS